MHHILPVHICECPSVRTPIPVYTSACLSAQRSLTLSVTRSSLKQLWFSELAKLPPPTPRAGRASNAPPSSGALQPAVTLTVSPAMLSCLVGDEGAWRQLWAWLPEWSQIKHPNMVFRATSNGYKSVLVLATGHSSWRCPPSPLSLPLSLLPLHTASTPSTTKLETGLPSSCL